jgi:hypothetical protein
MNVLYSECAKDGGVCGDQQEYKKKKKKKKKTNKNEDKRL